MEYASFDYIGKRNIMHYIVKAFHVQIEYMIKTLYDI